MKSPPRTYEASTPRTANTAVVRLSKIEYNQRTISLDCLIVLAFHPTCTNREASALTLCIIQWKQQHAPAPLRLHNLLRLVQVPRVVGVGRRMPRVRAKRPCRDQHYYTQRAHIRACAHKAGSFSPAKSLPSELMKLLPFGASLVALHRLKRLLGRHPEAKPAEHIFSFLLSRKSKNLQDSLFSTVSLLPRLHTNPARSTR